MDDVESEVRRRGRELREAAEERADRWTGRASHQASSVAHALRVAGKDLEEQGERRIAHWTENAADRAERIAGYLEEEDPRSMLDDVEEIARRNPGAFIGGTFAAGLLLGRFLRSSQPGGAPSAPDDHPRRI